MCTLYPCAKYLCVVFIKLFKIQLHVRNKLNVVAKHVLKRTFKFTLVRNQSGFRFKCKWNVGAVWVPLAAQNVWSKLCSMVWNWMDVGSFKGSNPLFHKGNSIYKISNGDIGDATFDPPLFFLAFLFVKIWYYLKFLSLTSTHINFMQPCTSRTICQ